MDFNEVGYKIMRNEFYTQFPCNNLICVEQNNRLHGLAPDQVPNSVSS